MSDSAAKGQPYTQALLHLAFPDDPAEPTRIHTEKVLHRPLNLKPTPSTATTTIATRPDTRTLRRLARSAKRPKRPTSKPTPLSAREKRALRIYEIPPDARKYDIYV